MDREVKIKDMIRSDKKLVSLVTAVLIISVFALAIPANANFDGDWYFKQSYPNYAPSGMPDFDQKQDQWQRIWCGLNGNIDTTPAGDDAISGSFIVPGPNCTLDSTPIGDDVLQWCFCGPTAVANCLWWFDSKYATASGTPGDGSDEFSLVQAYTGDDHSADNVPWLIADLANRMFTCMKGTTNVVDMEKAIDAWLNETGLNHTLYEHTSEPYPDFSWIESEIERSQDVILLLGFYEDHSCYWERIGGHFVTCAGVNSPGLKIALSDPFFDNNASGNGPGRMVPNPHPASYVSTFHNDAQNISHDYYNVTLAPSPSGPRWTLSNYPVSLNRPLVVNFAEAQYNETFSFPVQTVIEYAIVISPVPKPALEVDKTVWNGTAWVKELDAKINDTLKFKCTITNTGEVNLTQIRFWDILDCSLEFADWPFSSESYMFKPKVLHPDDCDWDLTSPICECFTELCPLSNYHREILDWYDTDGDRNVSACDQIELSSGTEYWYHVDRVPYTLNLSNASYGTKYFDSVLDWNEVDLSDPINSTWLEVCCCKDKYTLIGWNGCGHVVQYDTVIIRNERTLEEIQYTVKEVVKDLVVSREWELNHITCHTGTLEPNQNFTFFYNSTVVRCGVDNNTFVAKGNYSGIWYYSDPEIVTITVPCPSGDATESDGFVKDVYTLGEDVYATGSNFDPNYNGIMNIYVFDDYDWYEGLNIAGLPAPYASSFNVPIDSNGIVGPIKIWNKGDTFVGEFDLFFDADGDGIYTKGIDVVDNFHDPGFIIVGKVPALTPLGLVALIGLLSVIAISTLVRRKKR